MDPNMMQPLAPKMTVCQARGNNAFDTAKKRILDPMTGDKRAPINEESEESFEEEGRSKHKSPLTSHSTTTPSLNLKPNNPLPIA